MIGTATTFSRAWAMPSRWTFTVPPIRDFVERHLRGATVVVDPFCGQSTYATHGNDLARGGMDAVAFLESLAERGIRADALIFDPPYSPRQITECYASVGRKATGSDTQNARLYREARRGLLAIAEPGAVLLSFGWSSGGFGRAHPFTEILLVAHGGAHNDTICVAQTYKPQPHQRELFAAKEVA